MADRIIDVENVAELLQALESASGGETIELEPGDYGHLRLGEYGAFLHNQSNITITSADPNQEATLESVLFNHVSNVTVSDLSITTPYDDPSRLPIGVSIIGSRNIDLTNSTLVGPIVTPSQANQALDAYAGAAFGTGISIRYSSDVSVTGNDIQQYQTGAYAQRTDHLQFDNNEIHNFSNDAFDVATLSYSSISGNYMHDPKGSDQSQLHPDFIQIYTDKEPTNSHDLTIDDNIFVNNSIGGGGKGNTAAATPGSGGSQYMQTILLQQKNPDPRFDYQNITIMNNLIFGNQQHGIYVQNGHNLTIGDNTILSNNDGTDPTAIASVPGVILVGRASDADIFNNVTPFVTVPFGASNVRQNGNYLTNQTDPTLSNYVGKLFVDTFGTFHTDYSQGDLEAIPGSIVAEDRLGSSLAWNLNGIEQPFLYVDMQAGSGLNKQTFAYDATALFKTPIDLKGAGITLDFGDGTAPVDSFSGSHTYAEPGFYELDATIRLADGQTISGSEGVRVQTPVVLDEDFAKGLVDNSYMPNALTAVGARFVETDLGQALHLGGRGSYVEAARTYDTTGNEALTISFDFKKDRANGYGTMFQQVGTAKVGLDASGRLLVTLADGAGHSFTQKDDVDVADTAWHQATITFDGMAGVADYYIDGKLVGTQEGYTTGQTTKGNWSPYLGTAWGSTLSATYDNVEYLSGAMSGAQVAQSWAALQQSLGSGNDLAVASGSIGGSGGNVGATSGSDPDPTLNLAATDAAEVSDAGVSTSGASAKAITRAGDQIALAEHFADFAAKLADASSRIAHGESLPAHVADLSDSHGSLEHGAAFAIIHGSDVGDPLATSVSHDAILGRESSDPDRGRHAGPAYSDVTPTIDSSDLLHGATIANASHAVGSGLLDAGSLAILHEEHSLLYSAGTQSRV